MSGFWSCLQYKAEQKELTEKVKAEQKKVDSCDHDTNEQNKSDFDSFAVIIRKYVGITKLTPALVNEFVKNPCPCAGEDGRQAFSESGYLTWWEKSICLTDPQTEQKEANKQEKTA